MDMLPIVIEHSGQGERSYDIFSRLLKDRIIFLGTEIDDSVAAAVIAQMLFLKLDNSEADINLYIMSPGGDVNSALAIYDTMQHVPNDIATYCVGQAASAAALLLAAGTHGKRYALPSSRIMIHQPWGGVVGDARTIEIQAAEINRLKAMICERMSVHTGRDMLQVEKDCDRDNYMSAKQAKEYGMIDVVHEYSKATKKKRRV
jgi:ATP-dependent Clp protease protease subunit